MEDSREEEEMNGGDYKEQSTDLNGMNESDSLHHRGNCSSTHLCFNTAGIFVQNAEGDITATTEQ